MPELNEETPPSSEPPPCSGHEVLRKLGLNLLPPGDVDEMELRGRLWELLYALASQRVFLHSTDHLSDRELYAWMHDVWLNETLVCFPCTETSCCVDVIGSGDEADTEIWLRHYADEATREQWLKDFPEDEMPAHVDAPHDRDRWMPEPPMNRFAEDDGGGFLDESDVDDDDSADQPDEGNRDDDPLGLEKVDREIRIEKLKAELNEMSHGETHMSKSADCPPEVEEAFLQRVMEIEKEGWQRPIDQLNRQGVALLPPDELTDEALPAKLWELLHELACRGFYVLNSNHLSDREVYTALWRDDLREPAILSGRSRNGGWFHDFCGSGSDEHTEIWLRYYASEETREKFLADFPGTKMPPHEKTPFDRDWRLPKGPF